MQSYNFFPIYARVFLKINITLTYQTYIIKNVNFEKIVIEKFAYVQKNDYLCSGKAYPYECVCKKVTDSILTTISH